MGLDCCLKVCTYVSGEGAEEEGECVCVCVDVTGWVCM